MLNLSCEDHLKEVVQPRQRTRFRRLSILDHHPAYARRAFTLGVLKPGSCDGTDAPLEQVVGNACSDGLAAPLEHAIEASGNRGWTRSANGVAISLAVA